MMKRLLCFGLLAGALYAQNPVVRQSTVVLLNTVSATTTQTSSAVRLPNNSGYGDLMILGAGITGSPSGCQVTLAYQQSTGGATGTVFATQSFTPSTGLQQFNVVPSSVTYSTGEALVAVYSCSVYPNAGTITVTFAGNSPVSILGTVPVSGTVTTTPPSNASTNVSQFGGSNAVTGTGAGGAGIPRVTISNDSTLAANQSVNVAQMNGVATTMGNGVVGTGVQRVAIASDNSALPAAGQGATGSAVPAGATQVAGSDGTNLVAFYVDPCQRGSRTRVTISLTTNTQLLAGTAAKNVYICDLDLIVAAATNVALVEGTGAVCATGIAGMAGGTTAATGWNFGANGGMAKGNGAAAVFATATAADNVCLLVSAANQVSGSFSYVKQ